MRVLDTVRGDNAMLVMAGVVAILILASITVRALKHSKPSSDFSELENRVRSWWIMAIAFGTALLVGRTVSIAFFCLLSLLAFREYLSLIPTRFTDRRVLFWAYLAIPAQYAWIGAEWFGMFIIWIPVYVFLFLPMRMVLIGDTRGFLNAVSTVQWGLVTTVFSISHLAFLLVLPATSNPSAAGPALVLYLVLLTQLNDVAQYLWGKLLGRHKVLPTVSPGKTIEGLIGGLATTTMLACLLAPPLTPFDPGESLVAGVLIGVGGFIGDVVISALKRDLGVKDSGTMLPGHGGLLDRVDSLIYTAPLFFHFVYYVAY